METELLPSVAAEVQESETVAPTKERFDIKAWIAPVIAIFLFAGGLVWTAHVEVGRLDTHLTRLDRRLDKYDSVLRLLSSAQKGDIHTIIEEILSEAKDFAALGQTPRADKFVAIANKLTEQEANS